MKPKYSIVISSVRSIYPEDQNNVGNLVFYYTYSYPRLYSIAPKLYWDETDAEYWANYYSGVIWQYKSCLIDKKVCSRWKKQVANRRVY